MLHHVVCCMLHAARCMSRCRVYFACRMLHALSAALPTTCCAACCVACCMLHVACCKLQVASHKLRVAHVASCKCDASRRAVCVPAARPAREPASRRAAGSSRPTSSPPTTQAPPRCCATSARSSTTPWWRSAWPRACSRPTRYVHAPPSSAAAATHVSLGPCGTP